jgi:hypothetical protein
MELIAAYIFLWFGIFPKSFGKHLGVIAKAMREEAQK